MRIYDLEWINSNFPELDQVETLSSGGQKEVFKGYHKKYGDVVLKIIKPSDDEYQRTIREIKAAEIIDSDHVPQIYKTNLSDAKPVPIWLIEQYIPGKTLRQFLREAKKFSLAEIVKFLDTLLKISIEAEKKKIVHRDIKPENIILDNIGRYWLIDFGIARHLELSSLTSTSRGFGLFTVGYAAPEQFRNIKKERGDVLIDPQFYLPRADHYKLTKHLFWPNDYETSAFFSENGIKDMLKTLWDDYNKKFAANYFILPGTFSSTIDDDWKSLNDLLVTTGLKLSIPIPLFATLCLSSDALRSENEIHEILDHVESWDVAGFYLVPQHPNNLYLVEDAIWLANLLDLCAGLKNIKKKVIVGYANHQQLCLAAAKVDAIASGIWINVRMFPLEKFSNPEEGSISRRTTWYYCPQSLSEYQVTFLDIAQKAGILDKLKTDSSFQSHYANILFEGAQPTTVKFQEKHAFRHYLQCLKVQTQYASRGSFSDTINGLFIQLEAANQLLKDFRSKGVRGKYRDFSEVIDINISALDSFKNARGFIFSKKWNSI